MRMGWVGGFIESIFFGFKGRFRERFIEEV